MIGVGIVGCNYGRTVLIPAFRDDPRCEVIALAGTDAERTAEFARAANVACGLGKWRALAEPDYVEVGARLVRPGILPAIGHYALELGERGLFETEPAE